MRLKHFTVENDGFCGLFSPTHRNRNAAIIVLEDGHPDSFIVKTAMKWLNRSGVSAMGIGPEKYMKGVHNWPLENVENAIRFLQSRLPLPSRRWTGYIGGYLMIMWMELWKDQPIGNRHLAGEESLCHNKEIV